MSLQAVASTSRAVGVPEFRRTNFQLPEKYGRYTGDGLVTKPPVYPMRRVGSWAANTSLELGNVVYPDGMPKNSSIAQSKLSDEKERASAAAKIGDLQQRLTFVPIAVRPQIQAQIDELKQKYFPGQLAEEKNLARHMDLVAEMKSNKSVASNERASIYNQLKAIAKVGIGGPVSVAPSVPGVDLEEKMVESIVDGMTSVLPEGKPRKLDEIYGLLMKRRLDPDVEELYKNTVDALEAATPSPAVVDALYKAVFAKEGYNVADYGKLSLDPSVRTASDALKSIQTQLPPVAPKSTKMVPVMATPPAKVKEAYYEERTVLMGIKDATGFDIDSTRKLINMVDPSKSKLDPADRENLLKVAVNEFEKLKTGEKTAKTVQYLIELALIEAGADPDWALDIQKNVSPNLKKWDSIREKVKKYLDDRGKLSSALGK